MRDIELPGDGSSCTSFPAMLDPLDEPPAAMALDEPPGDAEQRGKACILSMKARSPCFPVTFTVVQARFDASSVPRKNRYVKAWKSSISVMRPYIARRFAVRRDVHL